MQLDWSTFALEVINLLILIWLLKRFLYQPVLKMIERRRNEIHGQLAQAEQKQTEAKALQQQYEQRLSDWEEEKSRARDGLNQNLERERAKRLLAMEDELGRQRQKYELQQQQQQAQWRTEAEDEALRLAAAFSSRLLGALSGPELNQRLQRLFLQQLTELPDATLHRWRENWGEGPVRVDVVSAIALDEKSQQEIRDAVGKKLELHNATWNFCEDSQLIAGLRVAIGSWLLRANVQDELRFFVEASHE